MIDLLFCFIRIEPIAEDPIPLDAIDQPNTESESESEKQSESERQSQSESEEETAVDAEPETPRLAVSPKG